MAIHASRYSGRRRTRQRARAPRSSGKRWDMRGKFSGAFLLVALAGIGFLVYTLAQPFPKLQDQKDYPISPNYKDRVNILLAKIEGEDVEYLGVVSLAEGERTRIISISPEVVGQIPEGKGEYMLSSAMRLGNMDGKVGLNLLRDAVSRLLAVPIDGYVVSDDAGWEAAKSTYGGNEDDLSNGALSIVGRVSVAWQGLPKGVYTSFSKIEFAQMVFKEYGTVEAIDTSKYEVAGSVAGVGFDKDSFDNDLGQDFNEKSVVHDHPRVDVVNASGVVGAGTEIARYVRNLGGEVVNVSTADKEVKSTQIVDHLGGSEISSRLKQVTRASEVTDTKLSQADVEVTVGEDAKDWF